MVPLPGGVHDIEPFGSARVAIVMLIELHAVFFGFFGPPGGNHVQREASSSYAINVGGLFREQRRKMKSGPHRDHQFQRIGDGSEGRGGGPGVERRSVHTFDIVQIQFGDEREAVANFFAAAGEARDVIPRGRHLLVGHIAQPAAEYGKPVAVTHQRASFPRKSTRRAKGSKPTMRGPSETKFESALTS